MGVVVRADDDGSRGSGKLLLHNINVNIYLMLMSTSSFSLVFVLLIVQDGYSVEASTSCCEGRESLA